MLDPITDTITTYHAKLYDLNGDGNDDVSVYLKDIIGGKAYLRIKDIAPEIPGSSLTGSIIGALKNKINYWFGAGIGLIIIVLICSGIYLRKRRK